MWWSLLVYCWTSLAQVPPLSPQRTLTGEKKQQKMSQTRDHQKKSAWNSQTNILIIIIFLLRWLEVATTSLHCIQYAAQQIVVYTQPRVVFSQHDTVDTEWILLQGYSSQTICRDPLWDSLWVASAYQQMLRGNESRYKSHSTFDRKVLSQPQWHLAKTEDVSLLKSHSAWGSGHSEKGRESARPPASPWTAGRRSRVISGHSLPSSGSDISPRGSAKIVAT